MNKLSMTIILILAFPILFPSTTFAQRSGPGMGMDMGMGGTGMPPVAEPTRYDRAFNALLSAKDDTKRQKATKIIREELETQYDQYLLQSKTQIDQLQQRLDILKQQLELRKSAKDELVSLEIKRITNEAKGLSWPSQSAPGMGGGMDMGMMGVPGMGGTAGMGMGGPGMGGGTRTTPVYVDLAAVSESPNNHAASAGTLDVSNQSSGDRTEVKPDPGDDIPASTPIKADSHPDIRKMQDKFKQVALACLNFESAHMRFPHNITDDVETPLLSWRVHILPYLLEDELYAKFKLDEPWNSDHNIALLAEMPDIYKSEGFDSQMTSNTALCVEAAQDQAVFWSKPQDLKFDDETELKKLLWFRDTKNFQQQTGSNVGVPLIECVTARCDGSTPTILQSAMKSTVRNFAIRNDGNVLSSDNRNFGH